MSDSNMLLIFYFRFVHVPVMWLLLISLNFLARAAVGQERDVTISISENNSIIEYGSEFHVQVIITNSGKTNKANVQMTYISSPHVDIKRIAVNEVIRNKITSPAFLTPSLSRDQTASVDFKVILKPTDEEALRPGYHVANILIEITWSANDGYTYNTGFKTVLLPYVVPGCDLIFDVTNNVLRKDQVSATSFYISSSPQAFGANSTGWCAKDTNPHQYIEILFSKTARLTSIRSSSRDGKVNWIVKYQLKYKRNGRWYYYRENDVIKNFTGYRDMEDNTFPWFLPPLEGDGIRIHPVKWEGDLICSKFSIQGCYVPNTDNCINPIGMEDGRIPDGSMSDMFMNDGNNNSKPQYARLNLKKYGWAGNATYNDWLQIDLGSLFKISRIAMQGGYAQPHRVTKFKFCVSNDTSSWDCVNMDLGNLKTIFHETVDGPTPSPLATNAEELSLITLKEAVFTRSIRIEPLEYETMKVIRTELYGCPVKVMSVQEKIGLMNEIPARTVLVDETQGQIFMCRRTDENSNCFVFEEVNGLQKWRGIPAHILNIVAMDADKNKYGVTKLGTYTINRNNSLSWMDISNELFLDLKRTNSLMFGAVIPQIIPNTVSKTFWWNFKSSQVSVSGRGLHLRETVFSPWKLVASWSCCGI